MATRTLVALFVLSCLTTPGLAQPSSMSQAIIDGELEEGRPEVAALTSFGGNGLYSFCSAHLIAPRVLLTAAHCVYGITDEELGSRFVFFGPDVDGEGTAMPFADIRIHRGWTDDDLLHDPDIALVILAEDAPVAPGRFRMSTITESEMCPGEYGCRQESNRSTEVLSIGYGITDLSSPTGIKHRGTMTVAGPGYLYIYADHFIVTEGAPSNVCFGDSGGPTIHFENDTWVQWGIHSFLNYSNCRAGQRANTSVDHFTDWILTRVEEEHGQSDICKLNGFYDDGICDPACPNEDPDCAKTCGNSISVSPRVEGIAALFAGLLVLGALLRRRQ